MNPLLPFNCYVPDAEARLMPDGRLYLYGSWDISGSDSYCSRELHCFSTNDMEHWVDHGVIFRNDGEFCGLPWSPHSALFAPDAIHRNGKYYLYVCGSKKEEGVAVADSPTGPFAPAERIDLADGDGIDPTVFVDDDGQAYYFWGQFTLRGAKLCDDMKTLIPKSLTENILTEWEHGFHEGASIRKRGSIYYMVYTDISRGKATCLSYATATSPLGPYTKGGVIIDNTYCDPQSWNDHGSIGCLGGKWYVFYHRSSQNKNTCRRVCAEPISFDENGLISEVIQTSSGASEPICAASRIPAGCACRLMGDVHIGTPEDGGVLVSGGKGHWHMDDWAEYRYLDFSWGGNHTFRAKVRGKGRIRAEVENRRELCSLSFDTEELRDLHADCADAWGVHPLWLFLEGEFELKDFSFENTKQN